MRNADALKGLGNLDCGLFPIAHHQTGSQTHQAVHVYNFWLQIAHLPDLPNLQCIRIQDVSCHCYSVASCSACSRPMRSMQCLRMLNIAFKHAFKSSLLKFLAVVMSMKYWDT